MFTLCPSSSCPPWWCWTSRTRTPSTSPTAEKFYQECPTAEIASLPPFKISQLDGQHSDTDDMPDDVNMITDKLAKLSSTNVCSTDIPPDPYPCRFCLLVSELPNYPSPKPTDPVCTVCRRPIDDRFNPHSCCDLLMHENCWGQHRCIGWEWSNIVCACMHTS